ncbi:hypothetical protein SAICODRAFT_30019 [Saitoella complicata NRRL Y-17804]|uniref:RING-type domain-containing protein n=1 Tax=Saitoella complicata (strain BCRC 22490 / CBS 7301 / JCM 7358 / NBRC 10748 / NRRL Y-17804) TaxID=698492 RepID=A0A0E9NMG8_SAICN|nr:uncharacterized protein SAICODRAFT_30019 [Saitoella complicata NRRL Y-17804]ODQ53686.1 hypothetical protein SAICODRAFT_30019 [Saitoella complicata NRRL Y-17804]GAO50866.1 hypothetical protein G7K_4985-t1 [Saitoella complicata NRRL Y-17804]
MTRHSKRNTSLAFFTAYERQLLEYGTKRRRLGKESFREYDACHLCLARARDPVTCPDEGHLFCRECILESLLAQRKEVKRLQKEFQKRLQEHEAKEKLDNDEAQQRTVEEFELVQAGLAVAAGATKDGSNPAPLRASEPNHSKKRPFKLDEEDMLKAAVAERESHKKAFLEEKAALAKSELRSYWLPSLTPGLESNSDTSSGRMPKLNPICPASGIDSTHELTLKSLVTVEFSEDKNTMTGQGEPQRICPSCKKGLSNGLSGYLAIGCGHVCCKGCVEKFIRESGQCFVCGDFFKNEKGQGGLIEMKGEGTSYAAKGNALAVSKGVAFQGG